MNRYIALLRFSFILMLLGGALHLAQAQDERKFVRKGTAEYEKGKFLESEIEYRRALDKNANSFEGNFNLGNSLFRQEKYDESMNQYEQLADTQTDKDRLSRIYHNIGNAHFAKQEFDKSIAAYKEALKNNPYDDETRYNLIVAQKMLQNQEQNKDNQDQKQDQQQQKEEQKPQEQPEPEKQDQQQQQQQESNMSKQDAERLLNAIQQDENELQKKNQKLKAGQKVQVEKNW